jgi:hypothetical protein
LGVVLLLLLWASWDPGIAEREADEWTVMQKYITVYDPLDGHDDGSAGAARSARRITERARQAGVDTRIHQVLEFHNRKRLEWASEPGVIESWCWTQHDQGDVLDEACRRLAGTGRVLPPGTNP